MTHDQTEAVVLGDRVGVMRDGRLLQLDTPLELYNRPADLFVAAFTGATNQLDGTARSRDGEFGAIAMGSDQLIARLGVGVTENTAVKVALRPDNVILSPPIPGPNQFPGRVLSRHYQGTQTVYELSLLGATIEAMEIGSAARHAEGDDRHALPCRPKFSGLIPPIPNPSRNVS